MLEGSGPISSLPGTGSAISRFFVGLRNFVRARPGDLVYIPARTAHIVVTESAKVHMAWHMYP